MISPSQRPFRLLFSPRSVFEAIRDDLRWEGVVALLILVVVGMGVSNVLVPKIEMEDYIRDQLERRSMNLSEDEVEDVVAQQEKFSGFFMRYVQPLVMAPLGYLIIALLAWVGVKLVGGELGFGTAWTVVVHSMMPWVVASLLWLPVILSRGEISLEKVQTGGILASNLGWLAPANAALPIKTLLASVDLFSFWTAWLLSLGLSITAKVRWGAAAGVVGVLWLLWILVKFGFAILGS